MPQMIRQARLKSEFAHLYPGLAPDVWVDARSMARFVLARSLPQLTPEDGKARDRVLDDAHFEFRDVPEFGMTQRILLIEPDDVERLLVRAILRLRGDQFALREAADLDLAIQILRQEAFDLILLGRYFPGFSSPAAVRAVIEGVAPATPVLFHGRYTGGEREQLLEAIRGTLAAA